MPLLEIKQLTKTDGNASLLPKIDLNINKGQCVAIQCRRDIGNLLLQLLIGSIPPSEGEILFQGKHLNTDNKSVLQQVGVLLLDDRLYERLKVKHYLAFFNRLYGTSQAVDTVIRHIGLADRADTYCSRLTASEKRRLQIGRCIIHRPQLVIMEDPEQNVDLESRIIIRNVIEQLTKKGTAVLLTLSLLEDAISITDQVYSLDENALTKIETSEEVDDEGNRENEHLENEHDSIDNGFAANVLQPMRVEKIPAKVNDKIILFDPMEIDYVESMSGSSHLYVKGEHFPCTVTLTELEQKLKAFGFYRCHRSYIVNLQRVREVIKWTRTSYSLILEDRNKSTIPLSKSNLDELKSILGF